MTISIKNNTVIISGTEEEFSPLEEAKIISKTFLEGGGTFVLSQQVTFNVVADVHSLLFSELVTKFRSLFPEGVSRQYGKAFKGNLGKVKSILKRFQKDFKYTDAEILEATEAYLSKQISLGKKDFIPQAHAFIYHVSRGSELESACELYKNGNLTRTDSKWR